MRRTPLLALLLNLPLAFSGCESASSLDAEDENDSRSFSGSYWDKVHCDSESPTLCYGHRSGTGAVWTQVYSQCYLDGLVTGGWLVPSQDGWGAGSCDPYGVPTSTPDYVCYTMGGSPICFGGDDGWWAVVVPECQDDGYNLNWLATGSCITGIYASGYDYAKGRSGHPNKARGWVGDDAIDLRPQCFVDQYGMLGMEADSCDSPWAVECWHNGNGPVCVGTREGDTMRVIAPSVFDDAVSQGTWILESPPTCTLDPVWEGVECFHSSTQPNIRNCVALMDNVLVATTDPCENPPGWTYLDFHGVYAWSDDPSNYYNYDSIPWEG